MRLKLILIRRLMKIPTPDMKSFSFSERICFQWACISIFNRLDENPNSWYDLSVYLSEFVFNGLVFQFQFVALQ